MDIKEGDKVRVKSIARMCEEFGSSFRMPYVTRGFNEEMEQYCGKIVTVHRVTFDGGGIFSITIDEDVDVGRWSWHPDMLEPVKCLEYKGRAVTSKEIEEQLE